MTLRFYRKGRNEATLRVTTHEDYHLAWHYQAIAGINTWMISLQWEMRVDGTINIAVLSRLMEYYDDVRILP